MHISIRYEQFFATWRRSKFKIKHYKRQLHAFDRDDSDLDPYVNLNELNATSTDSGSKSYDVSKYPAGNSQNLTLHRSLFYDIVIETK